MPDVACTLLCDACSHFLSVLSPTTGEVVIRVEMPQQERPVDTSQQSWTGVVIDDDRGAVVSPCSGDAGSAMLQFSVEDNGPGIPAEEQASVFTPFFKGRYSSQQGSGLNLSIAAQIVKLHGAAAAACMHAWLAACL